MSEFFSCLNRDFEFTILEGKELQQKFNEAKLSNQETATLIDKPLNTADREQLKNAFLNIFYIGLSIGNRIGYTGKFQWEIEEDKEIAEWLKRQEKERLNHV